ncbi:hypothetical protein [Sphingomonas sp. ERG5]|uniref:hypothetical protein n=1 Tax=Sphingomonas sp. ERG5 TaxID=1381597 RepID=UPI00054B0AA2|nr:hypothetical protein [Sphingomonas sp. ERG5]
MSHIDWPAVLEATNVQVRPPRKTYGLSKSLSEFAQSVPAIRPPFGLTLEFEGLHGDEVLAYRALLGALEGRANTVRVPLFDLWFAANDAALSAGGSPHSDGTEFSDGALYLVNDLSGVLVTGTQGGRTITADFGGYGQLLQGGLYFGLADHLYLAIGVTWEGTVATIRFSPSLRTDYAGEPLKLRPTMIARLLDDDTGQLMLQRGRFGSPTLEFEEAFDEPLS